jgi:hypothetical protein
MSELINELQIEKALKTLENMKKYQKKYNESEKGLLKRREASRRYYNSKKDDPDFLLKQCNKVKAYYQKKKNETTDEPILI